LISLQGVITRANAEPETRSRTTRDFGGSTLEMRRVAERARAIDIPMKTAVIVEMKIKANIKTVVNKSSFRLTKILEITSNSSPNSAMKVACCRSVEAYPASSTIAIAAAIKVFKLAFVILKILYTL
jgi:hypothetical protein